MKKRGKLESFKALKGAIISLKDGSNFNNRGENFEKEIKGKFF